MCISFLKGQSEIDNSSESTIKDGWKLFMKEKYEVSYPEDWAIDTSKQMGTSFFLFSPLSDEEDQFSENVNLIIQDLTGYNLTLDQYVELSENQIQSLVTDGKVILSERIKKDNKEFHKVIYLGKQGIFSLKFEQYFWMIKDKVFLLTLTCELNHFDEMQEVGEAILNSFTLK
jgi:hypothetical protein